MSRTDQTINAGEDLAELEYNTMRVLFLLYSTTQQSKLVKLASYCVR